jgi:small-conductance mechanosensitive channel
MPESEADIFAVEEKAEAQTVKRRLSPWWILGAIFVVLAVVLGVRGVRKSRAKRTSKEAGGEASEPRA